MLGWCNEQRTQLIKCSSNTPTIYSTNPQHPSVACHATRLPNHVTVPPNVPFSRSRIFPRVHQSRCTYPNSPTKSTHPILSIVMAPSEPSHYVTLISNDGFEFIVRRDAACVAGTIRKMLDPQSKFAVSPDILRITSSKKSVVSRFSFSLFVYERGIIGACGWVSNCCFFLWVEKCGL